MDGLTRDVRDAIRALRRRPGLALVTICTLAVGLGANTALFGVTRTVLLDPLPYPNPDRIVRLWTGDRASDERRVPPALARTWAGRTALFHSFGYWAAYVGALEHTLVGNVGAEQVAGAYVSGALFETLGVAPVRGRWLNDADEGDAVAVVVGVVGDIKNLGLDRLTQPEVYKPAHQWAWRRTSLVVRSELAASTLRDTITDAVRTLDADQPVGTVQPFAARLGREYEQHRFRALLVGSFGLVALGLAAVGIYAVTDGRIRRRTREFGVRLALGATPRQLFTSVLTGGSSVVAAGMLVGLVGVTLLVGTLRSVLFDIDPLDPLTVGAAVGVVGLSSTVAMALAARRATRVDPARALGYE
ncbi:MAG: hypothetical protein CL441_07990 [Acidimicrobiaceae bacterium]|nr:hypothetical protein [Acidimicrobiaceae bacterium]